MKVKIIRLCRQNPEYALLLERIARLEQSGAFDHRFGWQIQDVPGLTGGHVHRLMQLGILRYDYKSNRYSHFRMIPDPQDVLEAINIFRGLEGSPEIPEEGPVEVPPDLFDVVVGFDDIKEAFIRSLRAERPVHILLVSPPATAAKSTFLMELERIPGARFVSFGSGTTRAGLREVLMEAPKVLLIDEIDKVANPLDLSALLTWMESGRVAVDKHREHREVKGRGRVFAAANTTRGLSPELLSRFMVFKIPPYTHEQYVEVVRRVLTMREGADPELSGYIAERLAKIGSRDVRDAVRLARLASNKAEVDWFVEVIERYR